MKKAISCALGFLCALTMFGCSNGDAPKKTDIATTAPLESIEMPESVHFYLPDGTPMMAISSLLGEGIVMDGKEVGMKATLLNPAEIGTAFTTYGDCDLAIMPTVTAIQLMNKGQDLSYVSANVFGNLYVVGVGEAESLSDLTGKVVYTTAGTTIALLQYELQANNIAYEMGQEAKDGVVTIWSMSNASDYMPLLKQAQNKGGEAYGVFGEPAVTKCMTTVATEAKIVVDMQKEYEKLTGDEGYPQACLVARGTFAREYPEFIRRLVELMKGNGEYTRTHADSLKALYEKAGSTSLAGIDYTEETIARCNLSQLTGKEAYEAVKTYIDRLRPSVKALENVEVKESFFLQ